MSNRDCVGVQSTAHVHVLKIRLSLEKPTPTSRSVSFLFSGAELKKMDSNDRVISIYRPRHRKRLPIARKFSAIWGTLMVSKKN